MRNERRVFIEGGRRTGKSLGMERMKRIAKEKDLEEILTRNKLSQRKRKARVKVEGRYRTKEEQRAIPTMKSISSSHIVEEDKSWDGFSHMDLPCRVFKT